MAGKFEIYKREDGRFGFRLKAGNGEIIGKGGPFGRKGEAVEAVGAVMLESVEARTVEVDTPV